MTWLVLALAILAALLVASGFYERACDRNAFIPWCYAFLLIVLDAMLLIVWAIVHLFP